jgi:prolipoprotein diacylglyceryltransferase
MAIVFRWLARKPRPTGIYLSIFCIWYAIVRFALDFYRVADITYAGLTPAQYLCIVLLGVGVVVGIKTYRSGALSIVDKRQA